MKTLPIARVYNALVNADEGRPLVNLTKEQLLIYPKAVGTPEAERHFRKELLVRRGMEVAVVRGVERAEDRIREIMRYSFKNPKYETFLEKARKDRTEAQAHVEALPSNPYVVTHQEIVKYYRDTHWPEYAPMLQAYVDGSLFNAQTYGWATFLCCDAKTRRADDEAFVKLQAMASLCGDEDGVTYRSAMALWVTRVLPSIAVRRRFTDEEGMTLANVNGFSKELKKEYWTWWRNYNTSTVKWNWKDESGVAYDDRHFKLDVDIEAKF